MTRTSLALLAICTGMTSYWWVYLFRSVNVLVQSSLVVRSNHVLIYIGSVAVWRMSRARYRYRDYKNKVFMGRTL